MCVSIVTIIKVGVHLYMFDFSTVLSYSCFSLIWEKKKKKTFVFHASSSFLYLTAAHLALCGVEAVARELHLKRKEQAARTHSRGQIKRCFSQRNSQPAMILFLGPHQSQRAQKKVKKRSSETRQPAWCSTGPVQGHHQLHLVCSQ